MLLKRLFIIASIGAACCFLLFIACNIYLLAVGSKYLKREPDDLGKSHVALILGAKTYDGYLSRVLKDRVDAGILLKRKGLVNKLLLSGDHGRKSYDEVNNMKRYILENAPDIREEDIFLDHAGFDTYDSIVRAKEVFCVDNMIIVTQDFHMFRALFIAAKKGLVVSGYSLSERQYTRETRFLWNIRESVSRVKAVLDVLFDSKPKYLGEKISIYGNGKESWD